MSEWASAVQLQITLADTKPSVWRRIVVPGSLRLNELHEAIQTAMGWLDYHLHLFEIDGVVYAEDAEDMGFDLVGDEADTKLSEVVRAGMHFRYEYDFGDSWQHLVVVERIEAARRTVRAECLAGERACPPEDCGGPASFQRLIEVLDDPSHPDYEELYDAYGDFDPVRFDLAAVTEQLGL